MRSRYLVAGVLVLLLSACGGTTPPTAPTTPPGTISTAARTYLDSLLDIMQANSINRKTIDWTAFRQAVSEQAGNAQTIADLAPAIRTALGLLNDRHSSFQKADGTYISNPKSAGCTDIAAPQPQVPADIGYVRIGGFSGNAAASQQFASSIQEAIKAADSAALAGWLVDLRDNGGGNMWPMIAGVGPVLGEGTVGFFFDPDDQKSTWEYRNGGSLLDGNPLVTVPGSYTLRRPNPKVAVLTNHRIASSGEATVIAFRGRPDTRSFGAATCGLSTSNRGFPLSDGAMLILTTATMADRTGTKYGVPVPPDEAIADPVQTVERAIEWLRTGTS